MSPIVAFPYPKSSLRFLVFSLKLSNFNRRKLLYLLETTDFVTLVKTRLNSCQEPQPKGMRLEGEI